MVSPWDGQLLGRIVDAVERQAESSRQLMMRLEAVDRL